MECLFCNKTCITQGVNNPYFCEKCHVEYYIKKNNSIYCISYQKNDKYELDYYPDDKNFDLVEKEDHWACLFTTPEILEINEINLEKLEYYLQKFINLKVFI